MILYGYYLSIAIGIYLMITGQFSPDPLSVIISLGIFYLVSEKKK